MVLKLQYKGGAEVPLEVEGICPDTLRGETLPVIEKREVFHGNVRVPLAEFFTVSGDSSDACHQWDGDLAGVHWIGAGMTEGTICISSNGGRHIGSEMSGGQITVEGDASDWVGAEMKGGLIEVRGRAGHLIGSAYRGSAKGMTGGTILVHGDVGNEIGHSMRRGLLAVGGDTGDLVGFNMLAGTILIWGESGIRHGAGMKRGTIAFMGDHRPQPLVSFKKGCRYRSEVMSLILKYLERLGFPVPAETWDADFDLFHGDMIEGGRGEMLLKVIE
jgi:formylmethanofuran dehydrogenase subunit C